MADSSGECLMRRDMGGDVEIPLSAMVVKCYMLASDPGFWSFSRFTAPQVARPTSGYLTIISPGRLVFFLCRAFLFRAMVFGQQMARTSQAVSQVQQGIESSRPRFS